MPIKPDLDPQKRKYDALEPVLQKVNKNIALSPSDKRRSQEVLNKIVQDIISDMKRIDPLFNKLYKHILYGGSYFDGVKLKYPDEFDLDLVLKLPEKTKPSLEISDSPGYVRLKLNGMAVFRTDPDFKKDFSKMDRWFSDGLNYVCLDKFRDWFESVIIRAKNNSPHDFQIRKSGPAFTLQVDVDGKIISIDLVPSLLFDQNYWPSEPFRQNPTDKENFLIVPKGPKGPVRNDLDWRLSFQEQERVLIKGKDRLKDSIRLLKLLKQAQMQDAIASYYIKTVFLWMLEEVPNNFFSVNSLSYAFMMGLKYFMKLVEAEKLPYYWNERNNLLDSRTRIVLSNWNQRLQVILKKIEQNLNDPVELENVIFNFFRIEENKREIASDDFIADQSKSEGKSTCTIL